VSDALPAQAILAQARTRRARGIVLGARSGRGFRRFVPGGVSRAVVGRAPCPVLVVKGRRREMQRVLIGLDGSARSRRAVAFVSRLQPSAGSLATLLAVIEPARSTSINRLPASVRRAVRSELAALETRRRRTARREVDAATRRLERAGWVVKAEVRRGVPLTELLKAVSAGRADVVVVGARGVGAMERLLSEASPRVRSRTPRSRY
jgi:nucleotide-binding universal stress UspA family protein